jgi:hypothetical protein
MTSTAPYASCTDVEYDAFRFKHMWHMRSSSSFWNRVQSFLFLFFVFKCTVQMPSWQSHVAAPIVLDAAVRICSQAVQLGRLPAAIIALWQLV